MGKSVDVVKEEVASSWVLMGGDDSHARQVELLGSGDSLSKSQEKRNQGAYSRPLQAKLGSLIQHLGMVPWLPR